MAVLLDWQTNTVAWQWMFALRGIRLCTLDVTLADALAVLDENDKAEDPELVTTVRVMDAFIAFFAFWFTGIPFPVRRKRYKTSAD